MFNITLEENKQFINEMLANYKTLGAKKAFITREIKAQSSYLVEMDSCLNVGFFHGERIDFRNVNHERNILSQLIDIRNNL